MKHLKRLQTWMAALAIALISISDASAAVGTQFEVPIEYGLMPYGPQASGC